MDLACKKCGKEFFSKNALKKHLKSVHSITVRQYIVEEFHEGRVPKCQSGSGKNAKFDEGSWSFKKTRGKDPTIASWRTSFDYCSLNDKFESKKSDFTECKICGKVLKDSGELSRHIKLCHKDEISVENYVKEYFLTGLDPKCACGCGTKVKFVSLNSGYKKYKYGHGNKGKKLPSRHKELRKKQSIELLKKYESGERSPWNIGLTKETDQRILKASINQIKAFEKWTPEERQHKAEVLKSTRSKHPEKFNQSGHLHSQWKGGISQTKINQIARSFSSYKQWIDAVLERDDHTCQKCGSKKLLEVHHDQEEMSSLISRLRKEGVVDIDSDCKSYLRKQSKIIADYHTMDNVSGLTLCRSCHQDCHPYFFPKVENVKTEEEKRVRDRDYARKKRQSKSAKEKEQIRAKERERKRKISKKLLK